MTEREVLRQAIRAHLNLYKQQTGNDVEVKVTFGFASSCCWFNVDTGEVDYISLGLFEKNTIQAIVILAHELAEAEIRGPYVLLLEKSKKHPESLTNFEKFTLFITELQVDFRARNILKSWRIKKSNYQFILDDDECFGCLNTLRCFLFKKVLL